MNSETVQAAKRTLYSTLKELSQRNWEGNQPWLNPKPSQARPETYAAQNFRRADISGKIRNLKMSDMGTVLECEKIFAACYVGISIQHPDALPINSGKGGTQFHKTIEYLLPREHYETERMKYVSPFLTIPSIGKLTEKEYTKKRNSGITGMIDAYMPEYQIGLELKSIPLGWKLPDEVPPKALGQVAGYAYGLNKYPNPHNRKPVGWFWLYLQQDMRLLNPDDPATYRVFYKSYEELEPLFANIYGRCYNIATIIDEEGYDNAQTILKCYKGDACHCSN
jgi:hypothetical protein